MLCDQCGENEAIIHLTNIQNNQITTSHLCDSCAAENGVDPGLTMADQPLTDFLAQTGKAIAESSAVGPCAFCGMKLEDFKKKGRVGCSHCYVTFDLHLRNLLRRLHGSSQHVGEVYLSPVAVGNDPRRELLDLREQLKRAVDSENFELAADLRDRIKVLE